MLIRLCLAQTFDFALFTTLSVQSILVSHNAQNVAHIVGLNDPFTVEYKGGRVAESLSLTNAAFVLGKRFGMRTHRYIEHVNKIFSKPSSLP